MSLPQSTTVSYSYTRSPGASKRHVLLPQRRLSISSNSQWMNTAGTPLSPSSGSGYALSPGSGTFDALHSAHHKQQQQQDTPSLRRSPSNGRRTIRQLDPVSIFERLGLGSGNNSSTPPSTTHLTSQAHPHSHHPGPSPGREDAHLPDVAFEGIDSSDVTTPMPLVSSSSASSSHLSQSEMEGNTGPGRRSLSNPSSTNPGISIRQASGDSYSQDVTSPISPSGSTPRSGNPLLDIASVPPVDIDNPSIHPPHELKIVYPQQDGNGTPTSPGTSSSSKIIPVNEDILLPFVDRPTEVKELLESEPRNRGLFERLQEVFTPHPAPLSSSSNNKPSQSLSSSTTTSTSSSDSSHHKQTWQDISSILYAPRENLSDQEWIDSLKNSIFPKSTALWERLRACLGIDVDDEQGTDRFEELSSDFNPDPLGAGALLMNNGGTSSTGGEGTSAPGLGMGMGLAHSHSSSGEVFSLTSPPKIPPPSLSDDMLSPRAVLRTHGSGNNTGIPPMAIPGTNNQNLAAINQGLKMSPSAPAAGFGNNSPYASAGVSPAPSPSLGASGASNAAQGTRSIPIPNSGGDGSRSPSKVNVGNNNNPAGGGGGESTRMHRRTSSGGSSFRRSFAMSSISEDAPVVDFGPPSSTSSSGGPSTPLESNGDPYGSNSLSSSLSEDTMNNGSGAGSAGGVDLGNLLRLKGHSLDPGNGHANASSNMNPAQQIQAFHQQQQHQYQHHPSLQGSALSIGSASSFTPSSFGNSLGMSGHSFAHGQALPSPSNHPSSFNQNTASGGGGTLTHSSSSSSLGLSVDPHHHHHQQQQQAPSPSLSRSPSWNLGSAANPNRLSGSGGLAGGLFSSSLGNNFMPSSPSFNSTYNKRAYDEYNPVFESDDGSSVAGSVRSTGRGPGMRRSFGQGEAMSPIRNPAQHRSQNSTTGGNGRTGGGRGGFALAGIAKNTSTPSSGTASPISGGKDDDAAARNATPKPL